MAQNRLLCGDNVKPTYKHQALKLVGKRVEYLRGCDIDNSGRGYFFPKRALITGYFNRQLLLECGDSITISNIVEMKIIEEGETP